jgi:hypothetical protein
LSRRCGRAAETIRRRDDFHRIVYAAKADADRSALKTRGSLLGEDAALVLLFSLVASGQSRLRRIDGWHKIASMLKQHTLVAA